jgi:hypothetical protein
VKEFISILVAMIGAFPPLLNWLSDKAKQSYGRRLLEEAKARMEFLEAWLRVKKELPANGADDHSVTQINVELEKLLARYVELEALGPLRIPIELENLGVFRRGLLLYLPQSLTQWIVHISFYIVLMTAFFFLIGAAIPQPGSDPQFRHLADNPMVLVGLVPFGVIIVLLQHLAVGIVRARNSRKVSA